MKQYRRYSLNGTGLPCRKGWDKPGGRNFFSHFPAYLCGKQHVSEKKELKTQGYYSLFATLSYPQPPAIAAHGTDTSYACIHSTYGPPFGASATQSVALVVFEESNGLTAMRRHQIPPRQTGYGLAVFPAVRQQTTHAPV